MQIATKLLDYAKKNKFESEEAQLMYEAYQKINRMHHLLNQINEGVNSVSMSAEIKMILSEASDTA